MNYLLVDSKLMISILRVISKNIKKKRDVRCTIHPSPGWLKILETKGKDTFPLQEIFDNVNKDCKLI